ncbi:sulfite exporter TauE/SafE family protein [Haloglycomyces albus]|uniref:sulfite exporter TauE/SafE family protein n=1 Tax=Haloglycomyces albus TaxID=526067 RepID=UPI00046D89EE|nr:sulfite exporter TauE/SafE family protein [Haloglycomyces albus]
MITIFTAAVGGILAQAVNGSLGMGYGTIATTILLSAGITPVVASATVNVATAGVGYASGLSHWKMGNVHWKLTGLLAVPGMLGGFFGATALTSLSINAATPVTAIILAGLGIIIILKFARRTDRDVIVAPTRLGFAMPTGLMGGFLNALGGGGWGPVATPAMLATSGLPPAKVVGSVSVAEALTATAIVVGFWYSLADTMTVMWPVVIGLVAGGVVISPLAAWATRRIPTRRLGLVIGFLVVVLNLHKFFQHIDIATAAVVVIYLCISAAGVYLLIAGRLKSRSSTKVPAPRETEPAHTEQPVEQVSKDQ